MSRELLEQKLSYFFNQSPLHKYSKRSLVAHANDESRHVFYINSGYIRIFCISEKGEELTLTLLRPHDFFPLTYGMSENPNVFYAEALTPIEIWKAPQEKFLTFLKNNPEIYDQLTSLLLQRFDSMLSWMGYMVFSNAATKIRSILFLCVKRFATIQGKSAVLLVPLTHHDIATLAGITRETTSLEMKKLEHQGYITKHGKYIAVNNIDLLEKEVTEKETLPPQFLYL